MADFEPRSITANVCQPGDISVTPMPTGYEIRRALRISAQGAHWELITTASSAMSAGRHARELARNAGTRIWLDFGGSELIPMPDTT